MTLQRRSIGLGTSGFLLVAGGLVLQACGGPAAPASSTRLFATDFAGAARSCSAPKPELKEGETAAVTMTVGNDGGWCAITVAQPNGRPFDAGLLTDRPGHGKVFIHEVGNDTRIDYTPDRGFHGSDSFTATLIPGNPRMKVDVTVGGS